MLQLRTVNMRPRLLAALLVVLGTAGGFVAGRLTAHRKVELRVEAAPERPERDLSPKGEARTVLVVRTVPGVPVEPPAAVRGLGEHLATTATQLPALPEGGAFHAATFARLDGPRLQLRTVEWLDGPSGRVGLGPARTVEAPLRLVLPEPPRWSAALLVPVGEGRPRPGALVAWTPRRLVLGVGHVQGHSFGIIGGRW